jgi:hypothetical protein
MAKIERSRVTTTVRCGVIQEGKFKMQKDERKRGAGKVIMPIPSHLSHGCIQNAVWDSYDGMAYGDAAIPIPLFKPQRGASH